MFLNRMKIRYATIKDAKTLAQIGAETFWDTYHSDSHLEQEFIKNHIASTFTKEVIGLELEEKRFVYIIAENESEMIGYARLGVNHTREEISGAKPIEISRIYLRKKFWGKKLGPKLIQKCFEKAEELNCDTIWLSVWKYNERAINFYEKFGFKKVGEHVFDLAGSPQIDFLMQKSVV